MGGRNMERDSLTRKGQTMKIEITQTLDLEIPPVPAHIKATGSKKASIPIGELPPEALRKIGEAWKMALLHAAYPDMEHLPGEE